LIRYTVSVPGVGVLGARAKGRQLSQPSGPVIARSLTTGVGPPRTVTNHS
jgi:hypothetical protein